jgi:hypothetical protein
MLYLLDSSTLITANNKYYPVDRVPEFWEWLAYKGMNGQVKMPIEMLEEIKDGPTENYRTCAARSKWHGAIFSHLTARLGSRPGGRKELEGESARYA